MFVQVPEWSPNKGFLKSGRFYAKPPCETLDWNDSKFGSVVQELTRHYLKDAAAVYYTAVCRTLRLDIIIVSAYLARCVQ